ncbi:bifunctional 4-hydroxy-2-oxoglutarate aldolase/2-dehydro-3-deoxy-phosphogluconate aldolase [Streptomyces sp. 6N223]|uniref:bifunctional 4-hydroxy-2-oxoglutarate aldolase/2-dehydro-3-deoxy-phosphogluconate aldolase n=1 Tax=Streptomyces sp. 6N223 TaxID=3457412 RepID=UPI003FCFC49F
MPLPDVLIIYRGLTPDAVCEATEALLGEGLTAFEVTLDTPNALDAIAALADRFADSVHVGAGTVRAVADVKNAAAAGATFLLSPHLDPDVVAATKDAGLTSVPGAFTPTEAVRARAAGADLVKIFPIGPVGASYIRQLRQPLPDIPLLATGGVTAALGRQCLRAGCAGVGVGVGLIDPTAVSERHWPSLAASARRYLAVLRQG